MMFYRMKIYMGLILATWLRMVNPLNKMPTNFLNLFLYVIITRFIKNLMQNGMNIL